MSLGAAAPPAEGRGTDPTAAEIDKIFADYDKPGSPGCSVGVIRDGKFIYRHNYGLANLELNVPLSDKSVFYMGSVSKQFTAAAVLIAAEKRLLSFDDDIRKWLPEMPDYGHKITVYHLLHHTSGLRDSYGLLYLAGRSWEAHRTNAELLDLIAHQRALNFEPGTQYSYSNSNYLLLGEIVKRATGKPLSEYARSNIFEPLGMSHTLFYDDAKAVVPNRVAAYESDGSGGFKVAWSTEFDTVGAGGLMSTMDDMRLWDRNFYGSKIGSGNFVSEMQKKGQLNNGAELSHALGLLVYESRGLPVVSYAGALFAYRSFVLRFPSEKTTIITMCNIAFQDHERRGWEVAEIVLKDKLQPLPKPDPEQTAHPSREQSATASTPSPPARPAAKTLEAYVGTYQSDELETRYRLYLDKGELMLQNGWTTPFSLREAGAEQFAGDFMRIAFERDSLGHVTGFSVATPKSHDHPFKKID